MFIFEGKFYQRVCNYKYCLNVEINAFNIFVNNLRTKVIILQNSIGLREHAQNYKIIDVGSFLSIFILSKIYPRKLISGSCNHNNMNHKKSKDIEYKN